MSAAVSDPLVARILSFRQLGNGWHYGQGRSAPFSIVVRALALQAVMKVAGAVEIEAFPLPSGEIMVSAYNGKHVIDVTVGADETFDLEHEENDTEVIELHGVSFGRVARYLEEMSWPQLKSSDSRTRNISATWKTVSKALLSPSRMTASQSSTAIVPNPPAAANAVTYRDTTNPAFPAIQAFSYEYELIPFPAHMS